MALLPNIITVSDRDEYYATLERKKSNKVVEQELKDLKKMPVLSITLAFVPDSSLVESIYSKVSAKVTEPVLLEVLHDPKIIGGCILSYNGNYGDYSLSSVLDGVLKEHGF